MGPGVALPDVGFAQEGNNEFTAHGSPLSWTPPVHEVWAPLLEEWGNEMLANSSAKRQMWGKPLAQAVSVPLQMPAAG